MRMICWRQLRTLRGFFADPVCVIDVAVSSRGAGVAGAPRLVWDSRSSRSGSRQWLAKASDEPLRTERPHRAIPPPLVPGVGSTSRS